MPCSVKEQFDERAMCMVVCNAVDEFGYTNFASNQLQLAEAKEFYYGAE